MIILLSGVLALWLLVLSYIDIKTFRLPNVLTLSLIVIGLLQAWLLTGTVIDNIIGAIVAYLVFVGVEIGFKHVTGQDGLGRGDAKLFAAGGAWLGWANLPMIALIGSVAGIIYIVVAQIIRKQAVQKIPFGPFLAFAILCVWGYLRVI